MIKHTLRAALFAATIALPVTAGHSQDAAPRVAAPGIEQQARQADLPDAPQPSPTAVAPETVEPPVEAAPEPTVLATGTASYYAKRFHGRPTASGERFDRDGYTAAHRTLPFGSRVRVTNQRTGKSVVVRINDRGPFHHSRLIDVSPAAAEDLGLIARGKGTVELALLKG